MRSERRDAAVGERYGNRLAVSQPHVGEEESVSHVGHTDPTEVAIRACSARCAALIAMNTTALANSATRPVLMEVKAIGAAGKTEASVMPRQLTSASTIAPAKMPPNAASRVPNGRFRKLDASMGTSCVSRLDEKIASATKFEPPCNTK